MPSNILSGTFPWSCCRERCVDSSILIDAYMCQYILQSLVQIMTCPCTASSRYITQCWRLVNWTNFNEIWIHIWIFSFLKIYLNMVPVEWRPFSLDCVLLRALRYLLLLTAEVKWLSTSVLCESGRVGGTDLIRSGNEVPEMIYNDTTGAVTLNKLMKAT